MDNISFIRFTLGHIFQTVILNSTDPLTSPGMFFFISSYKMEMILSALPPNIVIRTWRWDNVYESQLCITQGCLITTTTPITASTTDSQVYVRPLTRSPHVWSYLCCCCSEWQTGPLADLPFSLGQLSLCLPPTCVFAQNFMLSSLTPTSSCKPCPILGPSLFPLQESTLQFSRRTALWWVARGLTDQINITST